MRGLSEGESIKGITPSKENGQPLKNMLNGFIWRASQSLFLEVANVANSIDLRRCATQSRNPSERLLYTGKDV